ncbi:MAG: alpha/beta fold hydrolase [Sinimarinibacterium sp.]|jgi:predicted alpha/beta hydrolase
MPFDPAPLHIACADGAHIDASRYRGGDRAAVLIAPALGVPRRFYQPFAQFLAGQGYDVLSIDYRGIGDSGRDCDAASIRLADWGRLDVDAALRWLWENSTAQRRVLVGHSLGGQLPGLTSESEGLAALVLVGASCPDPRLYPLLPRLRMLLMWRVLTPLLSRNGPYFPARRIGFSSVDVPAGAMRDWARWGLSPGYLFDPRHALDTAHYAQMAVPMLAYSFSDDDFAVPAAVDALVARYPTAQIDRRHIDVRRPDAIGHFGYFQPRMRDRFWTQTADWLDAIVGAD